MSILRPKIRSALTSFVIAQDGYHLKTDVLRIIEEEARLMKETERVSDALDRDAMDQLDGIAACQMEHFKTHLRVSSYHSVRALVDGYTRIEAVVDFLWKKNLTQLVFQYERKLRSIVMKGDTNGTHVRYSIELSKSHQQRENLLVVEVLSPQDGPSPGKAVCINQFLQQSEEGKDDDEDGWEDIEYDDDLVEATEKIKGLESGVIDESFKTKTIEKSVNNNSMAEVPMRLTKRQRQRDDSPNQKQDKGISLDCVQEGTTHDEYLAFLDPELMHEFVHVVGLNPLDDYTAFFLLMTFPFYEHEWDLVGYLLEEIFGDEDDTIGENDDEEKHWRG
jgi:hypothetical protein